MSSDVRSPPAAKTSTCSLTYTLTVVMLQSGTDCMYSFKDDRFSFALKTFVSMFIRILSIIAFRKQTPSSSHSFFVDHVTVLIQPGAITQVGVSLHLLVFNLPIVEKDVLRDRWIAGWDR
jgi:hypothetical protein